MNEIIKQMAKENGVKLWQIADAMGINDGNLSRKLRHELGEEEQKKVLAIIAEISERG